MLSTTWAVPPRGTSDELSDVLWVKDRAGFLHAVRPDVEDRAYCRRGICRKSSIELFDDTPICPPCLRSLGIRGFAPDYCAYCGAFVLGQFGVAGVHNVQRVGTVGLYTTTSVCPGTWQRFDADYIPTFEVKAPNRPLEGAPYDDSADATGLEHDREQAGAGAQQRRVHRVSGVQGHRGVQRTGSRSGREPAQLAS